MAKVFNISPRYPFLDVLASYIVNTAKQDGANIANDIILLPTRRACRHLKDIFLNISGGEAVLLPTILPLGDIDENGLANLDYENESLDSDLPPAISKIKRNLILSTLIKAKMSDFTEEQAYSLAVDLAHLMDTVEMEELSFNNLQYLVPEEYSIHWQETLEFLKIVTEEYPKILDDNNVMNPVARKVALIKKQIEYWKKFPPKGRVFAAGSTGSLVPISYMLRFISKMERGFLILPGLDKNISDKDFEILTADYPKTNQNHPQYGLLKLIKGLDLKISDVPELPIYREYDIADSDRELLSSHIMLSSEMNDDWSNLPKLKNDVLSDVSELCLDTDSDEVFAVAGLLRKAVAENKKALLITPDRKIAKSVANELKRWNIIVDDSAGIPASDTTTGNYIILVLKMLYDNFSPYSILAVLKHKYTSLGYKKDELDNIISDFENKVLRGKISLNTLDKMIQEASKYDNVYNLLLKIKDVSKGMYEKITDSQKYSIYDLLYSHLSLVENFVSGPDVDVNDVMWNSDLHSDLSAELSSLLSSLKEIKEENNSVKIDEMTASAYFVFISNYLLSLSLRPKINSHPNIAIMNSIEARLITADLYIMSGLNEDTFPSVTSDDPWMSRPMKAKFKLPLPERKIGLSSHDFVEFFCKKNVVMTHAVKVDGVNTITSRWLTKLSAIVNIANLQWKNPLSEEVKSWIRLSSFSSNSSRCKRPAPCPPVDARPKKLSATWIEKWYRDPYIIFANKILKLKKLDDINPVAGPAELGTVIHNSLEEFKKKNLSTFDELMQIMHNNAVPYMDIPQIDFWYTKFETVAKWFIDYEASIKNLISFSFQEETGKLKITPNFTITAKADRIDVLRDNRAIVFDYKTGTPPSEKEVLSGYAPQLPIEALILKNGGFDNIKTNSKIGGVRYIKLTGSQNGHISGEKLDDSIDEIVETAFKNLKENIELFSRQSTPYLSRPNPNKVGHSIENYSEYAHLARVKEWNEN
ncbi:MAG: double-strand break repair protein AddB [Alphaproteobacteria bacterium]|nr:double-strand break repair protein AddB [Alphaproteobacteria bacterium]